MFRDKQELRAEMAASKLNILLRPQFPVHTVDFETLRNGARYSNWMIKFPKAVAVCIRFDVFSRDRQHTSWKTSTVAVRRCKSLEDATERNYPNPWEVDASELTKRHIQRMR